MTLHMIKKFCFLMFMLMASNISNADRIKDIANWIWAGGGLIWFRGWKRS
jgi:hypothetical protein